MTAVAADDGARALVRRINEAWTTGRTEELRDLLDGRAVMVDAAGFEIEYVLDGREHREAGRDTFVLARDAAPGSGWRAVWRQMTWREA